MNNVADVLLGGGLVAIGVLGAAVADRIRGMRITRQPVISRRDRVEVARATTPTAAPSHGQPATGPDMIQHDVVAALIGAGYRRVIAARAVAACTPREQATPESWTAAALRRCAQGGAS